MLGHDNVVASIHSFSSLVPPMDHRLVSLLPLSHLLEQSVGLFYAMSVGADIHYVRSRNPRVIFDALRERRVTSMVLVPQFIDLFWSSLQREVDKRGLTRLVRPLRADRAPLADRRSAGDVPARSTRSSAGSFRLFLSAGAYLPPAVQQAWEDIGVTILQGYGSTETGTGCCTTLDDHGLGTVGRPAEGMQVKLADDGEILFKGPTLFHGYWNEPAKTAEAFTDDGWYRSGDIGHFDDHGRLILSGRKKDIIVLPNGFNVYPEDIENALRIAGIRDSVVARDGARADRGGRPGVGGHGRPAAGRAAATAHDPAAFRARMDAAVKAANATLGANQRIAAWRLWPDEDFPRTHTLKVKRAAIREWVAARRARCRFGRTRGRRAARASALPGRRPTVSPTSAASRRQLGTGSPRRRFERRLDPRCRIVVEAPGSHE